MPRPDSRENPPGCLSLVFVRVLEVPGEGLQVVNDLLHLLIGEAGPLVAGPGRHRRVGQTVTDDLSDVVVRGHHAAGRRAELVLTRGEVAGSGLHAVSRVPETVAGQPIGRTQWFITLELIAPDLARSPVNPSRM